MVTKQQYDKAKHALEHAYDFGEPDGDMAQDSFNSGIREAENIVQEYESQSSNKDTCTQCGEEAELLDGQCNSCLLADAGSIY